MENKCVCFTAVAVISGFSEVPRVATRLQIGCRCLFTSDGEETKSTTCCHGLKASERWAQNVAVIHVSLRAAAINFNPAHFPEPWFRENSGLGWRGVQAYCSQEPLKGQAIARISSAKVFEMISLWFALEMLFTQMGERDFTRSVYREAFSFGRLSQRFIREDPNCTSCQLYIVTIVHKMEVRTA